MGNITLWAQNSDKTVKSTFDEDYNLSDCAVPLKTTE